MKVASAKVQAIKRKLLLLPEEEFERHLQVFGALTREQRVERCRVDLLLFGRTYVPQWLDSESAPFHRDLSSRLLTSHGEFVIEAPRGFAKSTLAVDLDTLHALLYRRTVDDLLISATGTLAVERMRRIKTELEWNREIVADFGEQVGATWSEDEIHTKGGAWCRAKGSGHQIRGFRPQRIKLDDAERDDKEHSDVRTQEARDKFGAWYERVVVPALRPGGRIVWVGTPLARAAYLRRLGERIQGRELPGWVYLRYPAINTVGESIWPTVWPLSRLEERRRVMGSRAFLQEYMLDPYEDGTAVFLREWVRWFDEVPEDTRYYTVVAVDCAISTKETADYTAIAVVSRAMNGAEKGRMYVQEVLRGRWTIQQQVEQIYEIYRTYHPDVVALPKKALEEALYQPLQHCFMQHGDSHVPFVRLEEREDKVRRANAVTPMMENGSVYFQRKFARDAVVEMLDFPGGSHDDQVDAVVHALKLQQDRVYPEAEEALYAASRPPAFMASDLWRSRDTGRGEAEWNVR